ncbi:MAG: radical SAM protein [Candidatus Deferrimicrobiaceae bacterium]
MNAPNCPFLGLDSLWIQVAGLSCNLRCAHCFNESGPGNWQMPSLSREEVGGLLDQAEAAGVRDIVYTGGEPFLHPDMAEIAGDTLRRFPATILTNGTLLTDRLVGRLAAAAKDSIYSLEIRISLDAPTEEENDRIRGKGSFERALAGAIRLEKAGFLPIVTAVRSEKGSASEALEAFESLLRERGIRKPRVKFLPLFRIGREENRSGGYRQDDRVTAEMLEILGSEQLLCSTARMATARGMWVCPILVNDPGARMGDTLEESFRPFPLAYGACSTCFRHGAVCANAATAVREE